jgi:hypothetical protein
MEKFISGEAHKATLSPKTSRPRFPIPKLSVLAVGAVILLAFTFWGGLQFQKHHGNASNNQLAANGMGQQHFGSNGGDGPTNCMGSDCSTGSRGSMGQPPLSGTVTDVNAKSITIKTEGGDKTFTIDSNTQMLSGPGSSPTAFDASAVNKDEKVGIAADTSDSAKAQMVLLNYTGGMTVN